MQNPRPPTKIPLSAAAFIAAMKGETVADENGKNYTALTTNHRGIKEVLINNVVVTEPIVIKHADKFKYTIILRNNEFKEYFKISGGEFQEDFEISGGEFHRSFTILGGEFQQSFTILGGEFQRSFIISGGKFQRNFTIWAGEFQDFFIISGGEFQQYFAISGGEFQQYFAISGGKFQQRFRISGGEFQRVFAISGGKFQHWFEISGGEFQEYFKVSGGEFQEDFTILGGKFQQYFKIFGGEFKGIYINIEGGFINQLIFESNFNSRLKIFPNSKINHLIFKEKEFGKQAIIQINSINLNSLVITNFNNYGLISLINIQFKNKITTAVKQNNNGKYDLETKPSQSFIKINNSLLGDTKFQSVEFEAAALIAINKSDFTQASIKGKYFPSKLGGQVFSNIVITENRKENIYQVIKNNWSINNAELSDLYNDLANMMKKQGNKRLELNYGATQQGLLQKSLYLKSETGDFLDLIPLFLSQISNKHGKSWLTAFLFMLFVPAIFFVCYTLCLNDCVIDKERPFYYNNFQGAIQHYLQFAVPNIFRMNFVEDNLCALLCSILGKLTFGYGVYQFIQAFRRLGRR